ncbi:MAG: CRISPR-associated helicase Cas3' [Lachnospiraceae bacterium]|nr:CRISPR-associated helicase Cas3' [Lachnospiraceae bacterium]
MKTYLAHKAEDREQTVLEHLQETAKLAGEFAAAFGKQPLGELTGGFHDLGKCSEEFQARLRNPKSTERCDHSTAGALEAFKRRQMTAAMCIMGHHSGLLDFGGQMDTDDGTVRGRLKKGQSGKIPDYSGWEELCPFLHIHDVPEMDPSQTTFDRYMETKFLYSSLVDADFLNTEEFMNGKPASRGTGECLETLLGRLEAWLKEQGWLMGKTGINGMRSELLQTVAAHGQEAKRGIYTLTVPTGGGKTVSSLYWALRHGVSQGLDRVIYVIPYMNIIEQTAKKFREILGEENVLEHHSNVIYEAGSEEEWSPFQLASENWDMPIVVTTAVQFFESLFHNKSSRCRKLHNIANSVIIYDEVQMLPVAYWTPCIHAMEELSALFRATQVLCTATQPAITFPKGTEPEEITKDTKKQFERLKRVTFVNGGALPLEKIAEKLKSHRQALCIVNTKRTARRLYELLERREECFHLTTMMVPAHREEVLSEIKRRLEENLPCLVIATSLVEAGVDLDFQYVLREQAGLDSILQAAGRCNRNGMGKPEESIVEVFSLEGGRLPDSISQQVKVARCIMEEYKEWDSLEAIEAYFRFWRELRGKENLDRKKIMEKVEQYAFREIAKTFRLINEDTDTVYIPWKEEGKELVRKLRGGQTGGGLFRKLGRYSVNVYEPHYRELLRLGDIELIQGTAVLINEKLYDKRAGLTFSEEEGAAIFV